MNKLLNHIIEDRKGNYCHVISVEYAYDIESACDNIIEEYQDTEFKDSIEDFLTSLELYYIGDNEEDEEEVYNFDILEYIKDKY